MVVRLAMEAAGDPHVMEDVGVEEGTISRMVIVVDEEEEQDPTKAMGGVEAMLPATTAVLRTTPLMTEVWTRAMSSKRRT